MQKRADAKDKKSRPPVVAVVGHVDHGKTTLLDYIRKTNVALREAGGITQSVGAYEIVHEGKKITFIDTPGHEAFSVMRARGASVADLAILVVAADEGVKPQTSEALDVLKQTNTPFVVAITKIDTPNADVERVKNELLSKGVLLEGAGGDVSWQAVSGKTGEGVNELLDLILLVSDVAGFTYNPDAHGYGFVLEAGKDKRRGAVAHIIVKDGVLRRGDEIVTRSASGKVRILENFLGEPVASVEASSPAVVIGWEEVPKAGEEFWAGGVDISTVSAEAVAGEEISLGKSGAAPLAPALQDFSDAADERQKRLRAVLKADSDGALSALEQVLGERVEIIGASVGDVSDSDVKFAKSTQSIIIGFRVLPNKAALKLAEAQGVTIVTSGIIYELADSIASLEKEKAEETTGGTLEVLATFSATAAKQTVGGKVVEGKMRIGAQVEIQRNSETVGKGKIASLEQNKEGVREVTAGSECGLVIETSTPIEKGDLLVIL